MSSITNFVPCSPGQWVKLCELRPSRQSLLVQLFDGVAVLGFRTDAPLMTDLLGTHPVGLYHSATMGQGPNVFRLTAGEDGDCVTQEWFAWVIGITLTPPSGGFFYGNSGQRFGVWVTPPGVTSISIGVLGNGGASYLHNTDSLSSGGGGGAGAFAGSTLTTFPGETWTWHMGPLQAANVGDDALSWISRTGVKPTSVNEGVMADYGSDVDPVFPLLGSVGGRAVNCVGQVVLDGGNGGDGVAAAVPGDACGGGGGGGPPFLLADPTVTHLVLPFPDTAGGTGGPGNTPGGGGGTSGSTFAVSNNGGAAVDQYPALTDDGEPCDGTGGPGNPLAVLETFGGYGFGGTFAIGWVPVVAYAPVVTVIESFGTHHDGIDDTDPCDDECSGKKAKGVFTVPLVKLTPDGYAALKSLLAKVHAGQP